MVPARTQAPIHAHLPTLGAPACRSRGSAFPSPPALTVLVPHGMSRQSEALCWPLNLAPSTTERVPLSGPSLSVQLRASSHSHPPAHPPHSHLPAPPPCAHLQLRPLPSAVLLTPLYPPVPTAGPPGEALSPFPASQSGFCLHHSTKGGVKD